MEKDEKTLKNNGFIKQRGGEFYCLRIKTVGGTVTAAELSALAVLSKKFGREIVHFTSRQSVEIPYIGLNDIDAVSSALSELGLKPGACGPRVRTLSACQGDRICKFGAIDAQSIAKQLDARYADRILPHKLKIGVTGCANNCLKAEAHDIGIKGGMLPMWTGAETCLFCKKCELACPSKAITVSARDKSFKFDRSRCNFCGLCVKSCKLNSLLGENGYILYAGGRFGREICIGSPVSQILFDLGSLYRKIDAILDFFEQNAEPGERLSATLARLATDPKDIKD